MMYSKECWLVHDKLQAVTDSVAAFFVSCHRKFLFIHFMKQHGPIFGQALDVSLRMT